MEESPFYEEKADKTYYIKTYKYTETEQSHEKRFPHFHDSIEIIFVVKGEVLTCINGQEKILHEGEMGFVSSFTPHFYKFVGDNIRYVAIIGAQYFSAGDEMKEKTFPSFLPRTDNSPKIKHLLDCFYWDGGWGLPKANELLKRGFANTLLGLMQQSYPLVEEKKNRSTSVLVSAMQYIKTHYAEPLTLEFIAGKYGYVSSYFSQLFNKFTGMNFRAYVNRCRIVAATKMLRENKELPIYKVAELCGFESANTFYRAYAKYGETEEK